MNEANTERTKETVLTSLNRSLHRMMGADPRVVVIGEDILDPYGGAFKVTKGLSTTFPKQTFGTPLSESSIVGMATGMALRGFRPVAEIMFGDFLLLAADQLTNHAAKFKWMYNDQADVPLVVRTPMGGRRGYGPTHSQCLEKHFLGVPGLWVVAPNVLGSPGDLLEQSVLGCSDPVLFVESKTCYPRRLTDGEPNFITESYSDEAAPFPSTYTHLNNGNAHPDAVICAYGGMVPICLETISQLHVQEGLDVGLAVFTQLSPTPESHLRWLLDKTTPEVMIYTEERNVTGGWSAELMARTNEIGTQIPEFTRINQKRLGGDEIPVASSMELERQSLPQVDDLIEAVLNCF